MAGFFPDAPAPRMAYDLDGTMVYRYDGVTVTPYAASTVANMNRETFVATIGRPVTLVGMIFPRAMDLDAFFLALAPTGGGGTYVPNGWTLGSLETSEDTTSGVDGTWTQRIADLDASGDVSSTPSLRYRTAIESLVVPNVKGIRFAISDDTNDDTRIVWHLYGEPSAAGLDRLRLWHPTLDEEVGPAYFDWGDIAQNQPSSRQFRVKNDSPTLTATTITVSADVLTEASPTIEDQYTFDDGGGYAATATIASLAPGAISGVITVQRTRPSNAALSLWTARIVADAASMA